MTYSELHIGTPHLLAHVIAFSGAPDEDIVLSSLRDSVMRLFILGFAASVTLSF